MQQTPGLWENTANRMIDVFLKLQDGPDALPKAVQMSTLQGEKHPASRI